MQWFKENMMIVNPDNFQAIIIHRLLIPPLYIKINDININSENSVKLLGLEIGSKLGFDKHITELCKKKCRSVECLLQNDF